MTPDHQDTDDREVLPVNPQLRVRGGPEAQEDPPAEQGPAPADSASREAPNVPVPSRDHLSADQVEALLGPEESSVETNRQLQAAEGQNPGTES